MRVSTVWPSGQPAPRMLVDVDRRTERHHVVKRFNVFVSEADAAMTDRSANRLWLIGAVQSVAIAQVEAECAEHAFVFALARAEGRDDDIAVGDELLPFP